MKEETKEVEVDRLRIGSVYSMLSEVKAASVHDQAKANSLLFDLLEHFLFQVERDETNQMGVRLEDGEIAHQLRLACLDARMQS